MERAKTSTKLREWWRAMTRDEKKAWFIRNKQTYEPCKRKAFDNAGLYEEVETSGVVDKKHHLV
eukprot:4461988-Lingulodinium_polyedra.AAC.1